MENRRTYTVPEVAQMLGISKSKCYMHVRKGEIPGLVQLGQRMVLRKKVVDEWIDGPDSNARDIEDAFVLLKRKSG